MRAISVPTFRLSRLLAGFICGAVSLVVARLPAQAADWNLTGDLIAHDPSIVNQSTLWWVYFTGKGLQSKFSLDGLAWKAGAPLFANELSWWRTYAPNMGPNDVWAPDVHEFNGKTWIYYCVSEFGKNNSAIGLISASSIAAADWHDEGMVLSSKSGTDAFNALDPCLAIDADGRPWLSYGSYFDGIHVVRLDPATMKPTGTAYSIAKRDAGIEASNIIYHDGYYYLFVSIDRCCVGVDSTYKIAVGRSTNITGPYSDQSGAAMLSGAATVLEVGGTRWKGPGGQSVYNHNGNWVMVRHAYDANNNGSPTLRISDLYWDSSGWPTYTAPAAPAIIRQPKSVTLAVGSKTALAITATGANLNYQWNKNGAPIAGAQEPSLAFPNLQSSDTGNYSVTISWPGGAITSDTAVVSVENPMPGKLVNLSVRTVSGAGDQTLIVGFIVTGEGNKSVMVRATGPTLQNFGVSNILADPTLTLYNGQSLMDRNDNWATAPNLSAIRAVGGDKLGSYSLAASEAIVLDAVASGDFSAHVESANATQGISLVEIDDEDGFAPGTPEFDTAPRLANVSARAQVGTGDGVLIAGFIINGNVPKKLMLRGIGPTLTHFGVTGTLADPLLTVFDQSSFPIASNNDWASAPNPDELIAANATKLGDYTLDPREAVLVLTLPPGAYSAQVSGADRGTGVGLVEVFEL